MDAERLKNPNYIFSEDYFEETLERIRIFVQVLINLLMKAKLLEVGVDNNDN